MKRDYYEILGLSKNASKDEIKKAYRKLALGCHPDQNPNDKKAEAKFKELSEAYSILSDSEKKGQYDNFGHGGPPPFNFNGFAERHGMNEVFSNLFDNFFETNRSRGADLRYDIHLTLKQAVYGYSTEITIPRNEICKKCNGSGAKSTEDIKTCEICHGSGKHFIQQGFMHMSMDCPICKGVGKTIKVKCGECKGLGQITRHKKIKVNIPAGANNRTIITLRGEGEEIVNGITGNLRLFIFIEEHPIFKRDGKDLICTIPITITQACLGCDINITLLNGEKVKLHIPAGTQNGTSFRLKEKGVPLRTGRGDQYIKVEVEIPINLNKRQKEILRELNLEEKK